MSSGRHSWVAQRALLQSDRLLFERIILELQWVIDDMNAVLQRDPEVGGAVDFWELKSAGTCQPGAHVDARIGDCAPVTAFHMWVSNNVVSFVFPNHDDGKMAVEATVTWDPANQVAVFTVDGEAMQLRDMLHLVLEPVLFPNSC